MNKSLLSACLLLASIVAALSQTNAPAAGRLDDRAIVAEHLKKPAFQAAWTLYRQGRGTEAYDAFMVLFRESPGDPVVNFALGLSARSAGKFSQASMAFERILMKQPENARVRLELALTYYRMNQAEMARMNAEKVLESNPPPAVAANVRDLLANIKLLQSDWRTSAMVSASILYDNNVNAGPDSRIISIAPIQLGSLILDTLIVGDNSMPQDSFGVSVSGSFLGKRDIGRKGGWSAFGGLNLSHVVLEEARDYETTIIGALAGFEHVGKRGNLQIPVRVDNILLAGESFAFVFGTGINYSRVLESGTHWISGLSLDSSDYDGSSVRDPVRFSLSQGLRWRLGRSGALVSGLVLSHEDADDDIYTNVSYEPYVGGSYRLARNWRMQGRLSYRIAEYDKKEPLAPKDREDERISLSMDVLYRIKKDIDVGLTYQSTQNDSTFGIYEYTRDLVSIYVNWRLL